MNKVLRIGDTIKCYDQDEIIRIMTELEHEGVTTDFLYEKDGEIGLWLEVKEVEE